MNVEQFRADLCAWLDENDLTPGPDHSLQGHMRQMARVSEALYDAGWMRYGWPAEVGGLGGPALLRAIVGEEVVGRRLAEPGPYSMLEVLAPYAPHRHRVVRYIEAAGITRPRFGPRFAPRDYREL